jgi:type II secretory pathway predicted ATPase ExeA
MVKEDHLNTAAREVLDLPVAKRIDHIRRPRWIGYPRAKQLLAKLDDLFTHPKTHRMPNLLIVGDTNAGKTMLANRFVQGHRADDNPDGDVAIVPVLAIQAPPGPDESRFYNTILEALSAPHNPRERVAQKQFQVLRLLKQIGLRMLIIDEVHNILTGPVTKQRQFLNVLKYLGNDLQIPLVGLGTREALRALQADPQLANRFEPAALPRWQLNQEFQMLLASFERALPLRAVSRLADAPLARKLLAWSEGSLGELSALLTTAAVYAVTSGVERIDAQVLAAITWVPPSERRRQAERLV